ncbi:hypothetical protein HK101_006357 [Irineochytrium annulatum]|nr:hypothetical protein HK101_006357 [Irineochytrium annulatum]
MDLSLDEIIRDAPKENRGKKFGGRGGLGRGGGENGNAGRGGRGGGRGRGDYGFKRNGPYTAAAMPKRNPDEPWRHDMFEGSDLNERLKRGPIARPVRGAIERNPNGGFTHQPAGGRLVANRVASTALRAATGTEFAPGPGARPFESLSILGSAKGLHKISVTNLHPQASTDDVKAVFREFGAIQSCHLSHAVDMHGDQIGIAEIVFDNRKSSLAAIERYHEKIADDKS